MVKDFIAALVGGEDLEGAMMKASAMKRGVYREVVNLQIQIIASNLNYDPSKAGGATRSDVMSPLMEDMLSLLMREFGHGAITTNVQDLAFQQVRELFHNRNFIETLSEAELEKILMVVVPVAVMRNLLARHRVMFDPRKTPSWDAFSDKYQDAILQA